MMLSFQSQQIVDSSGFGELNGDAAANPPATLFSALSRNEHTDGSRAVGPLSRYFSETDELCRNTGYRTEPLMSCDL